LGGNNSWTTHSTCVKLLHKHDKLTQCCRAFTLALARLSCYSHELSVPINTVLVLFLKNHTGLCSLTETAQKSLMDTLVHGNWFSYQQKWTCLYESLKWFAHNGFESAVINTSTQADCRVEFWPTILYGSVRHSCLLCNIETHQQAG